ncbi:TetR/AcrR family transcriptional regulator [Streptomyces sp. NBC_00448]|uniref:TetR/AcrR family transcriptional regulator n=1 Tax=Streptomyces sp. NBC_00448 TaxID=2903652 RepID=UPI002E2031CD
MGHREELLKGAKHCLYEKGYARTTARDIVAASGTNLASIGYHYGTKEVLLRAALIRAMNEWGSEMLRALPAEAPASEDPLERFESTWTRMIELFPDNSRLWRVSFEVFAQIPHDEELRKTIAGALPDAHEAIAELFQGVDSAADEKSAQLVGMFHQALLTGVLALWLIDPEQAPTGRDLAEALRIVAGGPAASTQGASGAEPSREKSETAQEQEEGTHEDSAAPGAGAEPVQP